MQHVSNEMNSAKKMLQLLENKKVIDFFCDMQGIEKYLLNTTAQKYFGASFTTK